MNDDEFGEFHLVFPIMSIPGVNNCVHSPQPSPRGGGSIVVQVEWNERQKTTSKDRSVIQLSRNVRYGAIESFMASPAVALTMPILGTDGEKAPFPISQAVSKGKRRHVTHFPHLRRKVGVSPAVCKFLTPINQKHFSNEGSRAEKSVEI